MAHNQKGSVSYGRFLAGCGAAAVVGALTLWAIRGCDDRLVQDGTRDGRSDHRPDVPVQPDDGPRPDQSTGGPVGRRLVALGVASSAVCGILLAVVLASWWNPGSWWSSLSGDISSAGAEVKRLIRQGVDSAIRQVESVIDSGFHAVDATFDVVRGAIDITAHNAATWVDWAKQESEAGLDSLRHDAAVWVDQARHEAAVLLDSLRHDAAVWVDAARHEAAVALDDVVRDLIDPVIRFLDRIETWWKEHIAAWWDDIYRDVIAPIVHDLRIAYDWADELYHWYIDTARTWIETIIKAGDWIVWFAEHPFQAFEDGGRDLAEAFSLRTIEGWLDRAEDDVDQWSEDFARLIS